MCFAHTKDAHMRGNALAWWTRVADNRCTDALWLRASTYLVAGFTVVALACTQLAQRLLPAIRAVAVCGVLMTVHQWSRGRCSAHATLGSVVVHVLPYAVYVLRRPRASPRWREMGTSLAVLALVLVMYAASGAWPYCLPPIVVSAAALSVLVTCL